ncbi:sugar phosphate isomerase/epimerase [candidate division KSB1 bacterium]|nr:sugar phosphate isomerase/epimerase [candidate division KSB1 bacterium]
MKNKHRNNIGFTVQAYRGYRSSLILAGLQTLGIRFFELTEEALSELEQIKKRSKKIQTGFHLPIRDENGWDLSQPQCKRESERLVQTLNRHRHDLNLRYAVAHPPDIDCTDRERALHTLRSNLARLELPIYVENLPEHSPESYLEDLERLRKGLPGQTVHQCFDAAHHFIKGRDPVEQFRRNRLDIRLVHLSDCSRDKDSHLPFGVPGGELPLNAILETLRQHSYDGFVTLELLPRNSGDLTAYVNSYLQTVRSIDPQAYRRAMLRIHLLAPILKAFFSTDR